MTAPARQQRPDLPDDMALPPGMEPASLAQQLDAARAEVHRWRHANEHRTKVQYGSGSMHPRVYAAGLQARISVYQTLWALAQNAGASPPSRPGVNSNG